MTSIAIPAGKKLTGFNIERFARMTLVAYIIDDGETDGLPYSGPTTDTDETIQNWLIDLLVKEGKLVHPEPEPAPTPEPAPEPEVLDFGSAEPEQIDLFKKYESMFLYSLHGDASQAFVADFKDAIKVVSDDSKSDCYYWDQASMLWKNGRSSDVITTHLAHWGIDICIATEKQLKEELKYIPPNDPKYIVVSAKIGQVTTLLKKFKTDSWLKSVIRLIRPYLKDFEFADRLDCVSYLLPIKDNKCIDLRTCEVAPRTREHMFSFSCPVSFTDKISAEAEQYYTSLFVDENKTPSEELKECAQRCLGYWITGENDQKKFFVWTGIGNNGKSGLVKIIDKVFSRFAGVANERSFVELSKSAHDSELLSLKGVRRLNYIPEMKEGATLRMDVIKKVTGGDQISARPAGERDAINFFSKTKIALVSNIIPRFDGTDRAVIQRLVAMPFLNEFPQNARYVDDLIENHIDSLFSWIALGAKSYYETRDRTNGDGLLVNIPAIKKATTHLIDGNDILADFVETYLVITGKDYDRVLRTDITDLWRNLDREDELKKIGRNTFLNEFRKKMGSERIIHGDRYFVGFKLKESALGPIM